MPTMVLVEDERFERDSLAQFVDWDLAGVRIVGEAANGAQGLSAVLELQPDIVLADVKMPVMDGIEMARRIRAAQPRVKILFLSSYDNFEYARQAIDLNISAYLMKPLKEGELLRAIKHAVDDINEERLEQRIQSKLQKNYAVSVNLARQALVNRLLTGMRVGPEDAARLGLEWLLSPSPGLTLTMCVYDKALIQNIDGYMDGLNRQCAQPGVRVINVCINAGLLITLYMENVASGGLEAGTGINRVHEILDAFFRERGAPGVRIESIRCDGVMDPSEMYSALIGKDSGARLAREAQEKQRNKRQIADSIEAFIKNNYHLPVTLETIAKSMHFTPNYLGAVFKAVKNVSVNRFLMSVRVDAAVDLLADSKVPIADIAVKCGFGSITYFHKVFRAEKGVTPSEFRAGRKKAAPV